LELLPRYKFERLVAEAIDDLPDELQPVLDNVVVQIEERNSGSTRARHTPSGWETSCPT
jgi:predicted Zn-dependent protease with MMP-like domain